MCELTFASTLNCRLYQVLLLKASGSSCNSWSCRRILLVVSNNWALEGAPRRPAQSQGQKRKGEG